jgi:hypothetical protein
VNTWRLPPPHTHTHNGVVLGRKRKERIPDAVMKERLHTLCDTNNIYLVTAL